MSKYTTGELAKLCGVTVRTVQYYDTRGILSPSELSEGGRRLYTDDDLRQLRIICFLRDMGLPIDAIGSCWPRRSRGGSSSCCWSSRSWRCAASWPRASPGWKSWRSCGGRCGRVNSFRWNPSAT